MKKDMDCEVFQEQMEALVAGRLTEEGVLGLRAHALGCQDCAMLLKVHEHVSLPSLEELGASVPQEHLDTMWARVQSRLTAMDTGMSSSSGADHGFVHRRGRRPWLVPTLAAASVALLFSTGFLFSEWRQSSSRETQLAQRIGDLEHGLAELGARTDWVERTARLATAGRRSARAAEFILAGKESVTIADLQALLGRYPRDMVVLEASRIEALMSSNTLPPPELKEILSLIAEAYSNLGGGRGVRAGDLQEWLAGSDLPQDMVLPKAHILELLNRTS